MNQRIVIPTSLRQQLLHSLHAAHQGIGAMCQRAADSIFWPGISIDITRVRNECEDCNRIAKSNAMEEPAVISPPDFPFQKICADYCTFMGKNYLVFVDRYSNWPIVFQEPGKAERLVTRLRGIFETFGVPEELTSDGGPQFTAGVTQEFLKNWGVHHRLSSAANPHANNRAEVAVKTVKRMLMANTNAVGSLDVDAFQRAMLIYRNSIDPETRSSPAMVLFGRPTRDPIPAPLGKYCPHQTWRETMHNREKALAIRHSREREKWSEHTRELKPLGIGDNVYVQNLTGNNPLRWERTGVVVETKPFKQYKIKLDGSGRVILRNRKSLRKFTPFVRPEKPQLLIPKISFEAKNPQASTNQPESTQEPQPESPGHNQDQVEREDDAIDTTVQNGDDPNDTTAQNDLPICTEPTPVTNSTPTVEPKTTQKKIPLALRRLQPYNKAGRLE